MDLKLISLVNLVYIRCCGQSAPTSSNLLVFGLHDVFALHFSNYKISTPCNMGVLKTCPHTHVLIHVIARLNLYITSIHYYLPTRSDPILRDLESLGFEHATGLGSGPVGAFHVLVLLSPCLLLRSYWGIVEINQFLESSAKFGWFWNTLSCFVMLCIGFKISIWRFRNIFGAPSNNPSSH